MDRDQVIGQIDEAFQGGVFPGAEFLQGRFEGCEPGESIDAFREAEDWKSLAPAVLDASPQALSFFFGSGISIFSRLCSHGDW